MFCKMYCNIFGLLVFLFFINNFSKAKQKSYAGYKTYDIYIEDVTQKEIIYKLSKNDKYKFSPLDATYTEPLRVMVSAEDQQAFETILQNAHIKYEIVAESPNEPKSNKHKQQEKSKYHDLIDFKKFLTLEEIYAYLNAIVKNYGQYVTMKTIGKSYEKRDIYSIWITNDKNNTDNNVILIDAGMHPREWITHAGALYIINQLVEHYNINAKLLHAMDWLIIPVLNPDGYIYTHTYNRLWRKTRQRYNNTKCIGADINRNFPYRWQYTNNSCTEIYGGPYAASESETRALINVMLANERRVVLYISLHSFGRMILYPWAWTIKATPNRKEHQSMANAAAKAMKRFSHKPYSVGSPPEILYAVCGANLDYAFHFSNISNAFAFEMPGDNYMFHPPSKYILPYVHETWIGIKTLAQKVAAAHVLPKNIAKSTFNVNLLLKILYVKLSFIMSVALAVLITRFINNTAMIILFITIINL